MKRQGASLSHSAAGTAGFTVAELVAASAILFIILVGVLGAVEYAGASTRMAAMRQTGINVATAEIEKNRNLPWDEVGVTYSNGFAGNPPGTIPANTTVTTALGSFDVETEVWWARDEVTTGVYRAAYKKMRVTVSWTTPTAGRLAVETAVFGQGDTGNTGDIQIKAVQAEDPTKVVPGVTIEIDPVLATDGATSRAKTDADGIAFFSGIKTVNVSVKATSPEWLVDTTGIPDPTKINSGFQNLGIIYCQKACTAVVHVKSESVPNLKDAQVTLTDKDRNLTYQADSDSNGNATFEGLWISKGAGYEAVATFGTGVSQVESFSLTSSGQEYTHPEALVVAEPPSITVYRVVAGTETTITGRPWHVKLKNPSGVTVLDITTSEDSVTQQIFAGGTYTAAVTGVSGFLNNDSPGFAFVATASGANQACAVPMTPYFLVRVRGGGVGLPRAQVTVTKVGGGPAIKTIAGANPPGITDSNGEIGFSIVSDGDYNVAAEVNGISYNGPQIHITAASPPSTTYYIDVPLRHLIVRVKPKNPSSWKRNVGLYDTSNRLVATAYATKADPDVDFWVPAGMYTVVICGSNTSDLPEDLPEERLYYYGLHPLDSPGVPTDGSTLTVPSSGTYSEP
jgi:hypothetical protein